MSPPDDLLRVGPLSDRVRARCEFRVRVLVADPAASARSYLGVAVSCAVSVNIVLAFLMPPSWVGPFGVALTALAVPVGLALFRRLVVLGFSDPWSELSPAARSRVFFSALLVKLTVLSHVPPTLARAVVAKDPPPLVAKILDLAHLERMQQVRGRDPSRFDAAAATAARATALLADPSSHAAFDVVLACAKPRALVSDLVSMWEAAAAALESAEAVLLASSLASSWEGSFPALLDAVATLTKPA